MRNIWNTIVDWLENGDLVPLIIAVSVPHYVGVLQEHDWWLVASVLGFLVDLGHYRTIKSFLKGKGMFWMVVLTIVSYGFHVVFYTDSAGNWSWAFGAVVPVLLFALAYLSYNERWGDKARKMMRKKDEISDGTNSEKSGKRWNDLTPEEIEKIPEMTSSEIAQEFGVTKRTGRNWRDKAKIEAISMPDILTTPRKPPSPTNGEDE